MNGSYLENPRWPPCNRFSIGTCPPSRCISPANLVSLGAFGDEKSCSQACHRWIDRQTDGQRQTKTDREKKIDVDLGTEG